MALYEKVSAKIYSIYLKYIATQDIHVYSIDEVFIEATHYMELYRPPAEAAGMSTPHYLAMTMIRDVLMKLKDLHNLLSVTQKCTLCRPNQP